MSQPLSNPELKKRHVATIEKQYGELAVDYLADVTLRTCYRFLPSTHSPAHVRIVADETIDDEERRRARDIVYALCRGAWFGEDHPHVDNPADRDGWKIDQALARD